MDEQFRNYIVDCLNYWKAEGPTKAPLIWEEVVESVASGLQLPHSEKFDEAVCLACQNIRAKYPHDNSEQWRQLNAETASVEIVGLIKSAFEIVAASGYAAAVQYDADADSLLKQLLSLYSNMKEASRRQIYPEFNCPNEKGIYALWRSPTIHTPTYVGEGNLRNRLFGHRMWWGTNKMYVTYEIVADGRVRLLGERFLIAVWKPGANVK
jgi:hypothetical protein